MTSTASARSGYLVFIAASYKEICSRELCAKENALALSANTSIASSTAGNKTKAERVEKYMDATIGDMGEVVDKLDEEFLDSPDTQFEFKGFQDCVKMIIKKVEKIKITAKELINQALVCDLRVKSTKLEDTYLILTKIGDLINDKIQDHQG